MQRATDRVLALRWLLPGDAKATAPCEHVVDPVPGSQLAARALRGDARRVAPSGREGPDPVIRSRVLLDGAESLRRPPSRRGVRTQFLPGREGASRPAPK